jgi:arsenate reductase
MSRIIFTDHGLLITVLNRFPFSVAEMKKSDKIQVLFVCTGNSARSQMAEGLLREKAGDIADVCSAGTEPAEDIHPLARKMMEENGIDPSMQYPKNVEIYLKRKFDVIVTTCDGARENCPYFPGNARRYHWGLADPAGVKGDKGTCLKAFRNGFRPW